MVAFPNCGDSAVWVFLLFGGCVSRDLRGCLLDNRCPALGWPLATSQEDHLSCGVGSPLALGSFFISLIKECLRKTAFLQVAG